MLIKTVPEPLQSSQYWYLQHINQEQKLRLLVLYVVYRHKISIWCWPWSPNSTAYAAPQVSPCTTPDVSTRPIRRLLMDTSWQRINSHRVLGALTIMLSNESC